jgi:STAM-binding protein
VRSDLKKLEQLAPRIKRRYEEYQERRGRQLEALKALEDKSAKTLPQELDGLSIHEKAPRRTSYGERRALDARNLDNHSLAARLAQREVRRRDTQRRSARQAGVSEKEEQERRTGGMWGAWDDEYARQIRPGDDLSSQIQEVARLQRDEQRASYSQVGDQFMCKRA